MKMLNNRRLGMAGLLAVCLCFLPLSAAAQEVGDALQAYRNAQFQTAIEITLKELKADPSNMDSYAVLCWSLNSLKRYPEAIQHAQKGRQINPGDHRMVGILAEANFALRNDLAASTLYQQYISMALQLDVDNRYIRDAYRDLAEIFIRFAEFHHADIALFAATQYDRGKSAYEPVRAARLWARLGYAREQATDFRNAATAYDKAISLDESNPDAVSGRDRVRLRLQATQG